MNQLVEIKAPTHASWAMTNTCNLRCKHCGLSCATASPNELNFVEGYKLLHDLSELGVKHLILSGGECTLHSDFYLLACTALDLFEEVKIITNGRLGQYIFQLFEGLKNFEKLTVVTSLDGMEDVHDARRGKGSFSQVEETLCAKTRIRKGVVTTFNQTNFAERDNILDLLLRLDVGFWSVQMCLPAGRMTKQADMILTQQELRELADFALGAIRTSRERGADMYIQIDDCFGYTHPIRQETITWPGCHAGTRLMAIFPNGDISGCPTMPDRSCGNIREEGLKKIWESEAMQNIRQEPSSCTWCDDFARFCPGGCHAVEGTLGRQNCDWFHS